MDCERIRDRLAEDPAQLDPQDERHVAECAACAAFAARLARAEELIQKALRFDVNALKTAADAGSAPRAPRRGRRFALAGLAAGVAGAAVLWIAMSGAPGPGSDDFTAAVVAHWYEEPESWVETDVRVSNVALEAALAGRVEVDLSRLGPVTYARSCFVDGQWIPHLVVQGQQGPVMMLLIPGHRLQSPVPLSLPEEGLGGRLVPHGSGSIVVLGRDGEALESLEAQAVEAVDWTI